MKPASKFMVSFKRNGALYEETASKEELDKAFASLREASAKNISTQERMVKQIQVLSLFFYYFLEIS